MCRADAIVARTLGLQQERKPVFYVEELTIPCGERWHFQGDFDAGHCGLVKALAGVIPHLEPGEVSGDLWWFGRRRRDLRLAELGQIVGYVGLDPADHLVALRVRDELAWALSSARTPSSHTIARFLEFSRVADLGHREIRTLSSGERQRVALASCVAPYPRALMLLEAFGILDERTRLALAAFSRDFARDGGIVVSGGHEPMTHDLDGLRLVPMAAGKIVVEPHGGPPEEDTRSRTVVDRFQEQLGKQAQTGGQLSLGPTRIVADHGIRLELEEFTVKAGEAVGLVGSNGAGKSTLIEALIGLLGNRKAIRQNRRPIGILWGTTDFMPLLDGPKPDEPISPHDGADPKTDRAWQRFRWLWECAKSSVQFLLLDEPTLGLDVRHRALLQRVLRAFRDSGCGLVLASHDLDLVSSLCSRVIWLEQGRIAGSGPTVDLLQEYTVSARGTP